MSYSPIPAFGLDCGARANKVGLQLACALRARLVLAQRDPRNGGSLALTLTSGFSTGATARVRRKRITSESRRGHRARHGQRAARAPFDLMVLFGPGHRARALSWPSSLCPSSAEGGGGSLRF